MTRSRVDSNVPRRAIERPLGVCAVARAIAKLTLSACLTVSIHSASADDYPPPPGPYQSVPGGMRGIAPSTGAGRQSAEPISALREGTARVLSTGSSGRETPTGAFDTAAHPGPPRGGATERFRPAAATEYSQPAVRPRPGGTPASDRPGALVDNSASAFGDVRVGNGTSDDRTDRPRLSVDGGGPARRTPRTPVFRPPEATER